MITQSFKRKAGGTVTFLHRTHTHVETRYVQLFGASPLLKYFVRTEIVRWVTESMHPYAVVKDRGFLLLMKTGRPGYWVPSPSTVICDTRFIYDRTREKLAHVLQEYEGDVSLATDAWSSPNHWAFMAITVHFVYKGCPRYVYLTMDGMKYLLWLFEQSHTGENLTDTFVCVLESFGIEDKVSFVLSVAA